MPDPRDIVDIQGVSSPNRNAAQQSADTTTQKRPWIAVRFKCCSTYTRIYRNRAGTAYEGRCPKCGKAVKAAIGPGGTANRFFVAE